MQNISFPSEQTVFFNTEFGEKVPFKRIPQTDTPSVFGGGKNPSVYRHDSTYFLSDNISFRRHRPKPGSPTQLALAKKGEFTAACSTHHSVKLLNVYEKLDNLMGLCDALEIIGQLPPDSAGKLVDSWVHRFRQFCSQINEIRTQSFPSKKTKKA